MKRRLFRITSSLALAASMFPVSLVNAEDSIVDLIQQVTEETATEVYKYDASGKVNAQTVNPYGATYLIYPDSDVDAAGAAKLLQELGMIETINKECSTVYIVNPVGEQFNASPAENADLDQFKNDLSSIAGGGLDLNVIGIGSGSTFVNKVVSQYDWALAGVMSVGGETGDKPKYSVPAYVSATSSAPYVQANSAVQVSSENGLVTYANPNNRFEIVVESTNEESLTESFANAYKNVFSKNGRVGNVGGTFYAMKNSEERVFEYTATPDLETLKMTRNVVEYDLDGDGKNNLWYEYLPEATLNAAKGTVPAVVMLHGNGNDPRTQFVTSGWAEVAAENGIILIEPEWQGNPNYQAMTTNDSSTSENDIIKMLNLVKEKYPQIDETRVYVEGLSRGSLNSVNLGLTQSDVFAAVGAHSGGSMAEFDEAISKVVKDTADEVDTALYVVAGSKDHNPFVPFYAEGADPSLFNTVKYYQELNNMDVSSVDELSADNSLWFGMPLDNAGYIENDGTCKIYGGTLANDFGTVMSLNVVEEWGHWNYEPTAQLMWNFFSHYSKVDGTLIIDGKSERTVTASYDKAASEIIVPKIDETGKNIGKPISENLKKKLNTKDLVAVVDDAKKTITVDFTLKDANLASDYLNGVSPAGINYFNMTNYFTNVKQVKQLLDENPGYTVVDDKKNVVDAAYVDELIGLLQQINDFDPKTNLVYDYKSVYDAPEFATETTRGGTDVIAASKEGNAKLNFHIDSHGWWGYDLGAHDSITGVVVDGLDDKTANEQQHDLTTKYGNFFVIDMQTKGKGKWYMINNTDLENPTIYVSEDGREAFMIDVDFYGENVINDVIKQTIGDKCESLKIFATHNHPDHVNNLAKIAEDKRLKDIVTIVWPENEPHTVLDGVDLVTLFKNETIKDMEKITVADHEFQFVEIPDEHTPGGGQLADLTNKVIYSGDSLGAQVHLGGTSIGFSKLDQWLAGAKKASKYIADNGIKYNLGAHTPYLNTPKFADWVATAIEYAKEQIASNPEWKGGLVIVENGAVVTGERMGEIFQTGLTDREELAVASVNFRNDTKPQEETPVKEEEKPTDTKVDEKPAETKPTVTKKDDKKNTSSTKSANTSDASNQTLWIGVSLSAVLLAVIAFVFRKKYAK